MVLGRTHSLVRFGPASPSNGNTSVNMAGFLCPNGPVQPRPGSNL